jgi:chromate reductase
MMTKLLGIAGSLRAKSVNKALLRAAAELAPQGVELTSYDLTPIPLYNGDLDVDGGPEPVRAFKAAIANADGLLLATPEYNFGPSGVLKNAIDWASRPAFTSPLTKKPVAIVGASPGVVGTARAQGQLKQIMLGTASLLYPTSEFLCGQAGQRFDDALKLTDEGTRERLVKLLDGFASWIASLR